MVYFPSKENCTVHNIKIICIIRRVHLETGTRLLEPFLHNVIQKRDVQLISSGGALRSLEIVYETRERGSLEDKLGVTLTPNDLANSIKPKIRGFVFHSSRCGSTLLVKLWMRQLVLCDLSPSGKHAKSR